MSPSGTLIAIEGIDGAGKNTQTRLLATSLEHRSLKTAILSFPRYGETTYAELIADFLTGKLGPHDSIDPRLIATLYAGDRHESGALIEELLSANDVLLMDRYAHSNVAYQTARVDDPSRAEALRVWIEALEFGVFGMPRPDLVVLLDVPAASGRRQVGTKEERDYLGGDAADQIEQDLGYQGRCQRQYHALATSDRTTPWIVVRCTDDEGRMRSREEIAEEILQKVLTALPALAR